MYDSQKKYIKDNIKKVTLNYKVSEYDNIKTIADDKDIKVSTLCKAMIDYCIINNIDISAYLK